MLVDDEPDILDMLTDVLRSEGYDPVPFGRANDALKYCQDHVPAVVVTDLLMPELDGSAFVNTLRQQCADVPVLMMSASVEASSMFRQVTQAFIEKPFDLRDFLDQVHALAHAHIPSGTIPVKRLSPAYHRK